VRRSPPPQAELRMVGRESLGGKRLVTKLCTVDAVRLVCGSSMNPAADLDTSLAFVIGRIEEEATRSGEPLSDDQRFLLNHLPDNSALPLWNGADPDGPAVLIPRDAVFERLCTLARDAHNSDARLNPASSLDWEFAVAVLKLNRHPMSWLLRWAGMKERRPWSDRWLLIVGASLVIFCFAALMLIAGSDRWTPIPMDRYRCRIHCDLDSSVFRLTTDRGGAAEARY
jgi:hypothetical protein